MQRFLILNYPGAPQKAQRDFYRSQKGINAKEKSKAQAVFLKDT